MKRLLNYSIRDSPTNEAVRSLTEATRELQGLPAVTIRIVQGVTLASGVPTAVPHGLGAIPLFVRSSCPRGTGLTAGLVEEIRDGTADRSKYVTLKASGFGATITVDVMVA